MTNSHDSDHSFRFSLDGLFVFSLAVEHMNFTRAARELGITQAAVSRRIQDLEHRLGRPLFIRNSKRSLVLTSDGEKLYRATTTSLSLLHSVIKDIKRPEDQDTISVTSTAGFATLWLMQRITDFNGAYPNINIRLVLVDDCLDLQSEGIDVGIRYGAGAWSDHNAELLFPEYVYPVCHKDYLTRRPEITNIDQLARSDLLHVEEKVPTIANWSKWLNTFGIELKQPSRKLSYNNYPLLIQSCLNGHGVLLGWHHMIYDLIANKELVRPINEMIHTQNGFYVIRRDNKPLGSNAQLFVDWIFDNAEKQSTPDGIGSDNKL